MLGGLRSHLSYANVTATLALFVALGGSSYAAIVVTGKNVKNSSLTGRDVRKSSLTTSDVRDGSLLGKDFKLGQLPAGPPGPQGPRGADGAPGPTGPPGPATGAAGGDLAGTYPNPDIAAGAVDGSKIEDDSVTGADIAEASLGPVPSAASSTAVGGQNVVTANGFLNLLPGETTNVTATCPADRLAVRGVVENSANVTVNSSSYGRSTYTVNVTGGFGGPPRFVFTRVSCFGGAA